MKKLWISFLSLLIPTTAFALPVGNPWDASLLQEGVFCPGHHADYCDPNTGWCDAWSVRLGFYGDFVFDRHLRIHTRDQDNTIHRTEIYTRASYLALNFYDRIDIFGTLGATNIGISGPRREFESTNITNDYFFLETETDFSWSIGARGTIWECGCFGVGGEAQYFSTRPRINFLRDENDSPQYARNGDHVKYREWQLGIGVAYKQYITSCSTLFVPYAAFKWSRALMNSGDYLFEDGDGNLIVEDLENDRDWGYAIGLTLVGCEKASVTVEGRFVDERAVHVNAQFRF